MTVLKKNDVDLIQIAQESAQSQVAPNDPA